MTEQDFVRVYRNASGLLCVDTVTSSLTLDDAADLERLADLDGLLAQASRIVADLHERAHVERMRRGEDRCRARLVEVRSALLRLTDRVGPYAHPSLLAVLRIIEVRLTEDWLG